MPLDITNPAVRAYQATFTYRYLESGYTGLAFDNLDLVNFGHVCGAYRGGHWTTFGYTQTDRDPRFIKDVVTWAHAMRQLVKARYPHATVDGNVSLNSGLRVDVYERLMASLDLDYDEVGVTEANNGQMAGRLLGADWLQKIDFLRYLKAHHKAFVLNGLTRGSWSSTVPRSSVQWILANYLLVYGPRSYVYIYPSDSGYGSYFDRPEYHARLGRPTSGIINGNGLYLRRFERGLAIVNPSASSRSLAVDARYHDLYGDRVTSVSLSPGSAEVLVRR